MVQGGDFSLVCEGQAMERGRAASGQILAALGLHCCHRLLHGCARASYCGGFFCCGAQALGHCGAWA